MVNDLVSPEAKAAITAAERQAKDGDGWVSREMPVIITIVTESDEPLRSMIRGEDVGTPAIVRVVAQGTVEANRIATAWANLRYARGKSMGGAVHCRLGPWA